MRFQIKAFPILSEDDDQLDLDFNPKLIIDDSLVTTWDGGTFQVAPSTTSQQILFPKVAAGKYLLLIVWTGAITYALNSSSAPAIGLEVNPAATPDPILPYQKAAQPGVLYVGPMTLANPLTSLFISNLSTTVAARVQVAIVGEAV